MEKTLEFKAGKFELVETVDYPNNGKSYFYVCKDIAVIIDEDICNGQTGDAKIDEVLEDYIAFYQDRLDRKLPVDRASCPYNSDSLKDLSIISMNHSLFSKLTNEDFTRIKKQMEDDLKNYYAEMGGV